MKWGFQQSEANELRQRKDSYKQNLFIFTRGELSAELHLQFGYSLFNTIITHLKNYDSINGD